MPYEEDIIKALDRLAEDSSKCDVLTFLAAQWQAEQSHYWTRFAGFAALHVGLLVCANTNHFGWDIFVSVVGVCLAGLWIGIQIRSKCYVDRWKDPFHAYRRAAEVRWRNERPSSSRMGRILSSTSFALFAPILVLIAWGVAGALLLFRVAC